MERGGIHDEEGRGGGEAGGLAAAAVPLHLVCDVRSQMHGADVG